MTAWLSISSSILLLFVVTAQEQDCFSSTKGEIQKCYTDNGFEPPTFTSGLSNIFIRDQIKPMCERREAAKKTYVCAAKETQKCIASDPRTRRLKKYLPPLNRADEYVDIMCQNVSYWNTDCLNRHFETDVMSCIDTQAKKIDSKNNGEIICGTLEISLECTVTKLAVCGCPMVKAITDTMRGPAWPEGCSAPVFRGVKCNPDQPLKFIDDGIGNTATIIKFNTNWLLSVASLIAISLYLRN